MTYPTLEHVAQEKRPYPSHLLKGCESGLVLFAAAFLGHNDAIHFAEAEIPEVWCVDTDTARLREMKDLYPSGWQFLNTDAWKYAEQMDDPFDAVSVDTFTGDVMRRSLASLELWCSVAERLVTVTITDQVPVPNIPGGWVSSLYPRSEHVSWLVLER